MVEYSKVKLSDTQLKKLKTSVKNKAGTTLRISLKFFWWKSSIFDNKTKKQS